MTQLKRVIMLFEGRTGSSLLGDALNQNPRVSFLGEEVAYLLKEGWEKQQHWIESVFFSTSEFPDPRIKQGISVIGFKVKLREIADPSGLRDLIERHGIAIIHMTRENLIKQVVSTIRAMDLFKSSGKYNLREKDKCLVPGPSVISLDRFKTTLTWLEQSVERLSAFIGTLTVPICHVTYEEVNRDLNGSVRSILQFLNVPHATVQPRLVKVTKDDLRDSVVNYEEIKGYIATTRYAPLI